MCYQDLANLALEHGFSAVKELNMDSLIFREEIRAMCSADRCHSYGKTWRCPPAIGSIEDSYRSIAGCKSGIIVETIGQLEDDFDYETMTETMQKHGEQFSALMRDLRKEYPDAVGMGAGTCRRCRQCTYPSAPCRFPDDSYSSMEAYGLWVSDVCEKSGIPYNNGKGTITYISCVLFR